MEMVQKTKIVPFLNTGTSDVPVWVQIKKSTAFDLALNPNIQEFEYISDESPTSELKEYKPSLNQSLTMYKDEPDYEFVFGRFFTLASGAAAKSEILIVFFQEKLAENEFKAWKSECIISVQNLNSVDSTLTFDVAFGGTVKKGKVTAIDHKPVFSEIGGETSRSVNISVLNGSSPVESASVSINNIEKKTDGTGKAVFTLVAGKNYTVSVSSAGTDYFKKTGIISDSNVSVEVDISL